MLFINKMLSSCLAPIAQGKAQNRKRIKLIIINRKKMQGNYPETNI